MTTDTGIKTTYAQALQAKIEQARQGRAYQGYLEVRDFVLRRMGEQTGDAHPSDYWREELAGFEYMFDASPLLIEKLRHHCYHITGLHDYDYRSHHSRNRPNVEKKLKTYRSVDKSNLSVSESAELGGFGFNIDGKLYNIDTLKYYQVLLGLDHSGILEALGLKDRSAKGRPVVLEIGAGWGGLAYQFKTLFPNTTYVIVDLTPTLLFGGTYLKAMFPDARFLMREASDKPLSEEELARYDFVLVPHTDWQALQLARVDLAMNMVSFQEMTDAQVDGYAAKIAREFKAPHLYSHNRNISPNNAQISGVHDILGRYYQLEELELFKAAQGKPSAFRQLKQALGLRQYKTATANPDHLYRNMAGRLKP